MIPLSIPKMPFDLPWFIFDLSNYQLITSKIIPSDIRDSKAIILTEVPVPGMNYQPIIQASGGNRRISFTLPLIKRNNTVGNCLLLQQFAMLRNQTKGFLGIGKQKFVSYPKVLYYWGTGSLPQEYYVAKCDATHKQGWVNSFGQPQYSELEIELIEDQTSVLYKAEDTYRTVSAFLGQIQQTVDYAMDKAGVAGRPY
jgi:hypothetical protein